MSAIRTALIAHLRADATLSGLAPGGVHYRKADDEDPPYVIVNRSSGTYMWAFKGFPLRNGVWFVKGVGEAAQAEDIDDRCAAILNRATLPIVGHDHKFLLRISDVSYDEVTDGERYYHEGGEYRLVTEEDA